MADPRTLARTRMFGWRNYQPTPYYTPVHSVPVIVSSLVANPVSVSTSYLLDALGDILTDASGNRLTYL